MTGCMRRHGPRRHLGPLARRRSTDAGHRTTFGRKRVVVVPLVAAEGHARAGRRPDVGRAFRGPGRRPAVVCPLRVVAGRRADRGAAARAGGARSLRHGGRVRPRAQILWYDARRLPVASAGVLRAAPADPQLAAQRLPVHTPACAGWMLRSLAPCGRRVRPRDRADGATASDYERPAGPTLRMAAPCMPGPERSPGIPHAS